MEWDLELFVSFILANLIDILLGGVGQELMEGITMFLAVAVLFWVVTGFYLVQKNKLGRDI